MAAFTRRDWLRGLGALGGLAGVPLIGQALSAFAVPPAWLRKRFVFVVNRGGWDPLMALAPLYQSARITMPGASGLATAHGIPYVQSPLRPAVTQFFETYGASCLLLHGLSVRSVSHEVCETTMLTGHATGGGIDHATRLAQYDPWVELPHLVLAGPNHPGALTALVARSGATGQLQELIDGSLAGRGDQPSAGLTTPASRLVNDFVSRRTRAAAISHGGKLLPALTEALSRAERLSDLRLDVRFASDGSLASQLDIAFQVLEGSLAQCITVSPPVSWDTHTDSDNQQSPLWESLFQALNTFLGRLAGATVRGDFAWAGPLSNNVVVVVLSEMGRTPQRNADQGRDHWPWTSAMIIGPGITGGRVVGGYDETYTGIGVDPATGELDPTRPGISPAQLGATLVELGQIDSSDLYLPQETGVEPIRGVLS